MQAVCGARASRPNGDESTDEDESAGAASKAVGFRVATALRWRLRDDGRAAGPALSPFDPS